MHPCSYSLLVFVVFLPSQPSGAGWSKEPSGQGTRSLMRDVADVAPRDRCYIRRRRRLVPIPDIDCLTLDQH